MADLVMRKRGAMHAGELGLFIDAEAFEDEFASVNQGVDIKVEATQSRSLKQMRLAWGLAGKIAKGGSLGDADQREVMNYLLKKAKHVKYIANQHRDGVEVEVVVKSIRFAAMEQTAFNRLFNRMIYIVLSEILPDMAEGALRDEVEKMAGATAPDPEPPKRQRASRAKPVEPVSVIPPHDQDGVVIDPPPASDFPGDTPMRESPPAAAPAPAQPKESRTPTEPKPALPAASAAVTAAGTPKNPEQWAAFARAWIVEYEADPAKTDQDLMVRWNNERSLRNDCGVTSEDRQPIFVEYGMAIERMRGRGR